MSVITKIVDTNVILVANGQHQDMSPASVSVCAKQLEAIINNGRIALDDGFRILSEYMKKTQPSRGKRPGDAFVKWALQNNAVKKRCDLVPLKEHAKRGFVSFPDHPDLANFDTPDRKFVAVAAAHPEHPPILQAADSKWLDWIPALKIHGILVELLCQEDLRRFHEKKFGK